MSNELLHKVITTSQIGVDPSHGDGFLDPAQSGRFIDYMWDATTLGSIVRKVRMNQETVELNRMAIGERLLRVATEAVDDGVNAAVAFSKVSLTATKFRMDWELSTDALEDGLEGEALEEHVARLIASQVANDLEDLAINGDSVNHSGDALLKGFDGWRKRLYYGGNVVDATSVVLPDATEDSTLNRATFAKALRVMPRRYMNRRGSLRWLTQTSQIQDYLYSAQFVESLQGGFSGPVGTVNPGVNDNPGPNAGWTPAAPFGIPLQEVPLFPEYTADLDGSGGSAATGAASDLWLVDPKNLIWGIRREIQVYRQFIPKKDAIEYTMYTRVAANVENPQAAVVVKNVAVAGF